MYFLLPGFGVRLLAQEVSDDWVGKWHLTGQREMASGLELLPDSGFRFFYVYGASDRFAEGLWRVKGDTLILKSRKAPGKDFFIQKQSKGENGYRILVKDSNRLMIERIRCFAFYNGRYTLFESDRNGEILVDLPRCDSLFLQHPFFPDVASRIKEVGNPNHFLR